MPAFPAFDASPDSRVEPDAGIETRVTDGGTIRGRRKFAAPVYRIQLIYEVLSPTDRATLDSFYETNKDAINQVTIDGVTYDVRFLNKPMPTQYWGLNRTMRCDLIGTAV